MFNSVLAVSSFIIFMLILAGVIVYFSSRRYKNKLRLTERVLEDVVSEEKKAREKNNQLQNKLQKIFEDPVTNLFGWDLFEDRVDHAIKESERYQVFMAVLYIDIDNFKMINEALGTEAGDALLREAGKRIQVSIRKVDCLSRFAKDVFVVLLTKLTRQEGAALVAQRLLQVMTAPFHLDKHELYVTVGIGIAVYPGDGNKTEVLLRNAEVALKSAKEEGKGRYRFYQKELYVNSQRELSLGASFHKETVFQEITFFYQPIVNQQTQQVVAMAMQLQWLHPEWGRIEEEELFRLARARRRLNLLSWWMIEQAARTFLTWKEQGFCPAFISIPLSTKQLEDSHFIYQLSQILQKCKFEPSCLMIEIREPFSLESLHLLEKSFNMLEYLGLKIVIDRFGLNAFSLCSLKHLSISYLKLDSTLVKNVTTDKKGKALIQSIQFLATSLSIQVIAQGVSSKEEIKTLQEAGCSLMQGEAIAIPLAEQEVVAKMLSTVSESSN